jgi:hypothetical protein
MKGIEILVLKGFCHNPSFGLTTKAKGLQGCGPRGSSRIKGKEVARVRAKRKPENQRQRGRKSAGQEEAWESKAKKSQGCGPRGSSGITSHTPRNVRKCEGV